MSTPTICRLTWSVVLTGASLTLAGCSGWHSPVQRMSTGMVAPTNDTPMVVDQAMQIRDWDRSTAYYTNVSFVAGAPGFLFEPRHDNPYWSYAVLETPLFAAQVLALPITIFLPPQWVPVDFAGSRIEPSYHGMPPLPPVRESGAPSEPALPETPATPVTPPEPSPPVPPEPPMEQPLPPPVPMPPTTAPGN